MITLSSSSRHRGFTLVELLIVIVVISILAGIVVINFGSWRSQIASNEVQSSLLTVGHLMKEQQNFSSGYPSTVPSGFQPSANVIVEMTQAAAGKYCFNGYNKVVRSVQMSINSDNPTTVNSGLCSGAPNGSTVGGSVPTAPLGINIAPDLSAWTLTGTTTYDSSTQVLTMGSNGTATSPPIRVDAATGAKLDAQFFATTASPYSGLTPDGGWLSSSKYLAADIATAQANSSGYTTNGCAKGVTLNSWNASKTGVCTFILGNGIKYLKLTFSSTASGYASPDLKIKSPSVILY